MNLSEDDNMKGKILDIQRFSVHDGPGIRTTVFMKGCNLNCIWCHNPESISFEKNLSFHQKKCTACLACLQTCPYGVHKFDNGKHLLQRDLCKRCGRCVEACPTSALKILGYEATVKEIIEVVEKDRDYYRESNGGITVSGGEPLAQFNFVYNLIKKAKNKGLHTCLDTSGFAPGELIEKILPLVDLFLFDYKVTNPEKHEKLTGVNNNLILANLDMLYKEGANIILRCPLIPGVNDDYNHLKGIAELCEKYPELTEVHIMPYHDIGSSKYKQQGMKYKLKGLKTVDEKQKRIWLNSLQELGCKGIKLNN